VVLEPQELTRTVPDLHVEDLTGALFGPSDGYIDAVRFCELLGQLGKDRGGRVWQGARVTDIRVRDGRVASEVDVLHATTEDLRLPHRAGILGGR